MKMGNGGSGPAKRVEPQVAEEIPVREPEQIIIETVREVPVYVERIQEVAIPAQIIEKEVIVEKMDESKLIQLRQEMEQKFVLSSRKIDVLAEKIEAIDKRSLEAYQDVFKRINSVSEAVDMSDRTFVHIRQIQASQDELLNTLKDKIEKQEKYNKYLMLGLAITASLAIVASIL